MNVSEDKSKLRFFRFSLRTLLILITLATLPLCWLALAIQQAHKERSTITWVQEMGGSVGYERPPEPNWWRRQTDRWLGFRVVSVDLNSSKVQDLSPLAELRHIKTLQLENTSVTDLSPLQDMRHLRSLYLDSTPVSDLSPLKKVRNLKSLHLNDTRVTNLSPLANLKNLRTLKLTNTDVSDLTPLATLAPLTSLNLKDTLVSDVSPLAVTKNLKWIWLANTRVSAERVDELKEALPDCSISYW